MKEKPGKYDHIQDPVFRANLERLDRANPRWEIWERRLVGAFIIAILVGGVILTILVGGNSEPFYRVR